MRRKIASRKLVVFMIFVLAVITVNIHFSDIIIGRIVMTTLSAIAALSLILIILCCLFKVRASMNRKKNCKRLLKRYRPV